MAFTVQCKMVLDRLDIPDGSLLEREWHREWGPFNTEAAAQVWIWSVGRFEVNSLCLPISTEARYAKVWEIHNLSQP